MVTYTDENYIVDTDGVHTARAEYSNTFPIPIPKRFKDERISPIPIRIFGYTEVNGEKGIGVLWMPRKGFEYRSAIPLSYFDFWSGSAEKITEWVIHNITTPGLKADAVARYIVLCYQRVNSGQYDL